MVTAEPFADFIGVTVPVDVWPDLFDDLGPEFEGLGMSAEVDEDRMKLWRTGGDGYGTVKAHAIGQVWAIGISGTVCAGLRVAKRMRSVLSAIGCRPHRVTRLDASLDLSLDAAPIVSRITAAGRRGELSLTRKSIAPETVETHLGLRVDGVESGTVYCGSRSAEARMVVYDKRHERLSRKLPDLGNLTRFECRLKGGIGITLRDCDQPREVFWHHVAPDFLPRPDGVAEWIAHGSGFVLDRAAPPTPVQRMYALLERSPDVRRLLTLSDQVGPYGLRMLVSRLQRMASGDGALPTPDDASGLDGPPAAS